MDSTEQRDSTSNELVIVGTSAGGVEALSVLVSTLPTDFPAPIILAQHLDPERPSALGDILQRRATLPVEIIEDHAVLQPGRIYVVPSNTDVRIEDGHIGLDRSVERPRPSIDRLLSSAALIYAERLIAVILTGTGGDGAAGAVDVKNAGGVVVIQSPESARYPSMPSTIPPSIVDFSVDIQEIGPLLHDLLVGVEQPTPPEQAGDVLQEILGLVGRQANIDFRPYKSTTILRRINRRMTIVQRVTMRDYLAYLGEHPEEVGELVNAFLINVTEFFRDREAFDYLRDEVLPVLIGEARQRDRVLRLWSAGCATGEEPYSLAMLVAELLGEELPQWSIRIFATDLDEAAISFARSGVYTESVLKSVPQEYRERYFEHLEYGYRIARSLRQMVIFGHQDLSRNAAFPRIDLAVCRNVLIYFTPALQEYVLSQFAFSLGSSQGYLFLGKAETIRPNQAQFEIVNKQWKVYRCVAPSPILALPRRGAGEGTLPARARSASRAAPPAATTSDRLPAGVSPNTQNADLNQVRRATEYLLRFLPLGVAVIDRSYRLVTANAAARRLLGLREVGDEMDFLHAVRGLPYAEARNTIDAVFRDRMTLTLPEVELPTSPGGIGRFLSFSFALMALDAGLPELATISITDVTEQMQARRQLEASYMEQERLVTELAGTNQRLNDMNKDLLDANEELQVTNEEMMLTQEELQTALEEFESTNEELQATNEELETNNEELQATNEELQTTNDELRARTIELQELMVVLESERTRLSEIVQLAPFYITVLKGRELAVEAFNPRYARLLEGRTILGESFASVTEHFYGVDQTVIDLAREVYHTDTTRTTRRVLTDLPNERGEMREHHLVYTLVPTHDLVGRVNGVVIYGVDEPERSGTGERGGE
ncbi:MAG TPA: CheR family methyltransferase [Ardenticatenaceae bacterium]